MLPRLLLLRALLDLVLAVRSMCAQRYDAQVEAHVCVCVCVCQVLNIEEGGGLSYKIAGPSHMVSGDTHTSRQQHSWLHVSRTHS